MNFVYGKKTGKIIGTFVNGEIVPLQPAPTGDALDDLLFSACEMIEKHPLKHGRLAQGLRNTGKHSPLLVFGRLPFQMKDDGTPDPNLRSHDGGGLHAFIAEGSLRTLEELREALIEYVAHKEELFQRGRLGTANEWEFTITDLWTLGKKFGLAGPPSPPTAEQRAAQREADEKEREARRREANTERLTMADLEREIDIKHRKKRLLNKLTNDFFTLDDVDLLVEPKPPEYFVARRKRDVFRECNHGLIELLVDQGKNDEEIVEEVWEMNAITKGVYLSSVPDPLKDGETRQYVATSQEVRAILSELDATGRNQTHVTTIQGAMDGRYCITIRPKTQEDFAREAVIDGGAQ